VTIQEIARALSEGNRNLILGIMIPPPGYSLKELENVGRFVEEELRRYWEAEPGDSLDAPALSNFFFVALGQRVFMGAAAADPLRARELIPLLQQVLRKIPGMIPIVTQTSLFAQVAGSGRSIDVDISGPDLERLVFLGRPYLINLSGTADDLTRTRKVLQGDFILALVITFLLMASLFGSFLYPLVIMFSVPLAAAGGFLGLFLINRFLSFQPLDVLTMLGFVILIGVVVNNAILIVHQALNFMRERALPPHEAIRESVRTRIRANA